MCGLTGFLATESAAPRHADGLLLAMCATLAHRGPDAEGCWHEPGIGFGHRRLAIVDLSEAGAQPMLSACGRFVIAFNGEIYNHMELRGRIERAGAAPAWRGHSDTETLLAAIALWGLDEALRLAGGMFALALWDRRERRLSLARDRMGEKPLYWGWAGGALVFASELKALRVFPGFPREVCRDALRQYLRFGYVPAPRSIHPGIYKLEPGTILEVGAAAPRVAPGRPLRPGDSHEGLFIRRHWSLAETVDAGRHAPFTDDGEALEALEVALEAAVGRQLVADVPVGAFLSGGVDSSLIVALMQKHTKVRSFTIGFEQAAFDEAPHAATVARHLGTEHSELTVTEAEAREGIPLLPDIYDEPFADSSQIPTWLVCRMARSHVTVALSGDAGDELFGGYNRYFWAPKLWRRFGGLPAPLQQALAASITLLPTSSWDGLAAFAARAGLGGRIARFGDKAHKLAASLRDASSVDDLYRGLVSIWRTPEALVRGGGREPLSMLDDPLPESLGRDVVARMMVQDMRTYLPDDILCKVDRAAMAVSLEARVPFLDPEVVALSARLPTAMKVRNGQGKWALRQILYRHVPAALIERPKAGFGIPVGEWLRGPLRPWAEDLLAPALLEQDGLLNPAPIRQAWSEHLSGRRDWTNRLWSILMFQAWRERWQ